MNKTTYTMFRLITGTLLTAILVLFTPVCRATTVSLQPVQPVAKGIELEINIIIDTITGMYGLALDIAYDPAFMTVVDADPATAGVQPKITEGNVFSENGATDTLLQAALLDRQEGRLVLGLSRTNTDTTIDISGNPSVLTLYFTPLQAGSTTISFKEQALLDAGSSSLAVDTWPDSNPDIKDTYSIFTSTVGQGHLQPGDEIAVLSGTDITIQLIPDNGFTVANMEVNDKKYGPAVSYTFTNVTSNRTFLARFRRMHGDINADAAVNLTDAIIAGKVVAQQPVSQQIYFDADVNDDRAIGTYDLVFILQKIAGLR